MFSAIFRRNRRFTRRIQDVDPVGPTLAQFILVDKQSNMYVGGPDTYSYSLHGVSGGGVIVSYFYQLTVVKYDLNGRQVWVASYANPGYGGVQSKGCRTR